MPDENKFLSVPVAIIIAGALIAAAIYFGQQPLGSLVKAPSQPIAQPPAVTPAQPAVGTFREITDADHIRGAANAKITLLEYSDLQCPFCASFHPTVQKVLAEHPNDVRWIYRHAPLSQIHPMAQKLAEGSECANEQGKFWEFVDTTFEAKPASLDQMLSLATQAGVANATQFKSCVDTGKYAQKVADDLADANSAGMRGTPYSVVIGPKGQKLPVNGAVAYESLKATVDSVLK